MILSHVAKSTRVEFAPTNTPRLACGFAVAVGCSKPQSNLHARYLSGSGQLAFIVH
jgi:hypothetical protein